MVKLFKPKKKREKMTRVTPSTPTYPDDQYMDDPEILSQSNHSRESVDRTGKWSEHVEGQADYFYPEEEIALEELEANQLASAQERISGNNYHHSNGDHAFAEKVIEEVPIRRRDIMNDAAQQFPGQRAKYNAKIDRFLNNGILIVGVLLVLVLLIAFLA